MLVLRVGTVPISALNRSAFPCGLGVPALAFNPLIGWRFLASVSLEIIFSLYTSRAIFPSSIISAVTGLLLTNSVSVPFFTTLILATPKSLYATYTAWAEVSSHVPSSFSCFTNGTMVFMSLKSRLSPTANSFPVRALLSLITG